MMWSNRAFGIYMGDGMSLERDAAHERDLMVQAIAREQAIGHMAECEPAVSTETERWADTTRSARSGRTATGAARS